MTQLGGVIYKVKKSLMAESENAGRAFKYNPTDTVSLL